MFKPKHVAPFFSLSPAQLSEILREIHLVYPFRKTQMGSFLIEEKDLPVIETYLKLIQFFGNKKVTLYNLKSYLEIKQPEATPEWTKWIKNSS